ncbi:MAG: PilZ domain-containing protein [Desulfovibrionaceae bacterium]|nr:PilZ domain-containing protein [Desulfovibrionaceae bacterium]
MSAKKAVGLLVLADKTDLYAREMNRLEVPVTIAGSVSEFLERLSGGVCRGLVMDIQKVMRAPRAERDRLFRVSESYPILRTKVDRSGKNILFLDDVDCFLHNCGTFCPERKRCALRYPVKLNAFVSREDDPAMLAAVRANILNISHSGCFVLTLEDFSASRFVHVRIAELTDPTPIFGLVRWWRPWGEPGMLPGIGVVFMDVKPGHLAEIDDMCQDGTGVMEPEDDDEAACQRHPA